MFLIYALQIFCLLPFFPFSLKMLIWCAFALITIRSLRSLSLLAMENIPFHMYEDLFDNICIFFMCMEMHLICICLKGLVRTQWFTLCQKNEEKTYIYYHNIFRTEKKTSPALSPWYPLVILLTTKQSFSIITLKVGR